MRRALVAAQLVVFALLCGAGLYSNYEGSHGFTDTPDATHTNLIQYGHGGPRYVPADQFFRWEATWGVIALLMAVFIGLLYLSRRYRR